MRLTLRTMLAYLDDILEPQDAKELGAKIEESEFATALVQRIRNCTRRLRLGAPKLDGKGVGLDANTVAEYLDNTLPQDRVPDFEKVCLESDVHLAEVASCHQILTLVLGEPATVDPQLRDRVYHLPGTSHPHPALAGMSAATAAPPAANGSGAAIETPAIVTKRPEVPDYLRVARRRSWKPLAATVTLALLLVLAVMLALGRLDESHPLLGRFFRKSTGPTAAQSTGNRQGQRKDASAAGTKNANRASKNNRTAADAGATADDQNPETVNDNLNEPNTAAGGEESSVELPDSATLTTDATPPQNAGTASDESIEATITATPSEAAGDEQSAASSESAEEPAADDETEMPPDSASESGADATASDATAEPTSPATTAEVGRYIAGDRKHVLSRLVRGEGWRRLPEREVLHAGDELLALPSYRPQIALTAGVQLTVVGPSRVHLETPDDSGAPVLTLTNATALIDTVGAAGTRIVLDVAGRRAVVTFATPDATLAVQVHRNWPLGEDPRQENPVYVCRLMATTGQIEWREGEKPAIVLNSGQTIIALGETEPEVVNDLSVPEWATSTELQPIELFASKELEGLVDTERSLSLSLMERIKHRQVEVASLAIASLCAMDEFEPAINAFRSDDFRAYWRSIFDRVQWALSGEPASAVKLRAVLEKIRPDDAAVLYRLLWGFSNDQLAGGEDRQLIDFLEHKSMDVRVLAHENLRRITGRPGTFHPENNPGTQQRQLRDWKTMLEKDQIRWPK